MHQGHGDKVIVAYIQCEGEPLEVVEVHYNEEQQEVNLGLDY